MLRLTRMTLRDLGRGSRYLLAATGPEIAPQEGGDPPEHLVSLFALPTVKARPCVARCLARLHRHRSNRVSPRASVVRR